MSTAATERTRSWPLKAATEDRAAETQEKLAAEIESEELLRIVHHDGDALLALFRRYHALAFSIGCRILRDKGEAEDLVQEVFLRLFDRENTFDSAKGMARTWIVQMIYRRAFDRRAYLNRRHFYRGTDVLDFANALVMGKSVERDLIERLDVQQLRAAFCELSEKQRTTLELYFFEGLTLSEIAEQTGEDVRNVRHSYYRGLEHLRRLGKR